MILTTQVIFCLLGYYVVNAAVGAMPKPKPEQVDGFYGWLFGFLQTLCANADRLAEARFGHRLNDAVLSPASPKA